MVSRKQRVAFEKWRDGSVGRLRSSQKATTWQGHVHWRETSRDHKIPIQRGNKYMYYKRKFTVLWELCLHVYVYFICCDHSRWNNVQDGVPAIFTLFFLTQVVTRGEYSPASDVYAVGCIGIEMLTGEPPWPGLQPHQALDKVNNAMGVLYSINQVLGLDV